MTLRMADGPVDNLPPGLDAYAGYVNRSGIGITYPAVVAKYPNAHHLSITTNHSSAMCADVESGAMSNWTGYDYGYCSVAAVNNLIRDYGRPRKLWTAHYDPRIGAHICSPQCWPGLSTTADGTQWIDHNGAWDESLLSDNFFDTVGPTPIPLEEQMPFYVTNSAGTGFVMPYDLSSKTGIVDGADAATLLATGLYKVIKLADAQINAIPNAKG